MKYIMFEVSGTKVPVLFSKLIRHDAVATYLRRPINDTFNKTDCKPVSAGFYDPQTGAVYGESESLKIKSNPDDAAEIELRVHN